MAIKIYWSHLQHSDLDCNLDDSIFCHMSIHIHKNINVYIYLYMCTEIYVCMKKLIISHPPPEGRQSICKSVILTCSLHVNEWIVQWPERYCQCFLWPSPMTLLSWVLSLMTSSCCTMYFPFLLSLLSKKLPAFFKDESWERCTMR